MSTHPASDQLSAYLDGELEEAEAAAVEAALEGDAELQAELDRLKSVQRLLRSLGPARAPAGFKDRVMAAAREEEKVVAFPWWRRPFGVPVEGVLVAAAAALVLIVALPQARDPATTEVAPAAAAPSGEQGDAGEGLADAGEGDDAGDLALGAKGVGQGGGGTADGNDAATGYGSADGYGAKGSVEQEKEQAATVEKAAPEAAPATAPQAGSYGSDPGATDNAALPVTGASGTDVEDPKMAASGLMVQLYTEHEDVLGTLQGIVARYGGAIRDTDGRVVTTGLLDAGETRIWIEIASSQVSSLNKELQALGATIESTSPTITAGSSLKVPVRIVVTANGPSEPAGKPNAARSKMEMDDALEAAEP